VGEEGYRRVGRLKKQEGCRMQKEIREIITKQTEKKPDIPVKAVRRKIR